MIGGVYCRKLAVKTGSLLATQFGSENWFVAGRAIQHRKLFRCKHLNFDSECYFAAANTLSAANADSLQRTQFRQQITNSLQTTQFWQRMRICSRKHTFSSECRFAADNTISAANADLLQHNFSSECWLRPTQFWQRTLIRCRQHKNSAANADSLWTTQFWHRARIRCRQHTFASEHQFAVNNTILAANVDSLWTIQFQQRMLICYRLHNFGSQCRFAADNTKFQQRMLIRCEQHNSSSECKFAADNTILTMNVDSLRTQFWQRILIFCRLHNFDSECGFAADNTKFQQRMLIRCE